MAKNPGLPSPTWVSGTGGGGGGIGGRGRGWGWGVSEGGEQSGCIGQAGFREARG
jgi:hypothetical protein